MKRRGFTLGIGAAALPLSGRAQQASKLRRVGYLGIGTLAVAQPFFDVHHAALR